MRAFRGITIWPSSLVWRSASSKVCRAIESSVSDYGYRSSKRNHHYLESISRTSALTVQYSTKLELRRACSFSRSAGPSSSTDTDMGLSVSGIMRFASNLIESSNFSCLLRAVNTRTSREQVHSARNARDSHGSLINFSGFGRKRDDLTRVDRDSWTTALQVAPRNSIAVFILLDCIRRCFTCVLIQLSFRTERASTQLWHSRHSGSRTSRILLLLRLAQRQGEPQRAVVRSGKVVSVEDVVDLRPERL